LIAVPTIYSAIARYKDAEKYDLSCLKLCISGAAPLSLEVKNAFERVTGCALIQGYGLTETSPACTVEPAGGANKPGSVGLPLPGTIIEVVSLKNPNKILSSGIPGEVCVSGPQVMTGYWKQEAETEAVLSGRRLRTGDIGYLDEEGYLFIIDRIKDMIITGGFKVYPRNVEEALRLHPAVEEAMVCAVPDRHRGETVKAYVKLRADTRITAPDLRAFLRDKLATFEIPSEIEFLMVIPKRVSRKASQKELLTRARLWKPPDLVLHKEVGLVGRHGLKTTPP
jgi:long-chain acyl-CoA synthetase